LSTPSQRHSRCRSLRWPAIPWAARRLQLAVRHPERTDALILVDAAGFPMKSRPRVPLAFRLLQYPIGRAILRNIDNRPADRRGLKTDVYDKSLITPAWSIVGQSSAGAAHRAILIGVNFGAQTQATADVLGTIKVPALVLHARAMC